MRVIEVEAEEKSERWLLWLLAGTAVGVTVGVLAAERYGGRRPDLKKLGKRLKSVAALVGEQWAPLVDVALELKDQWDERRAARPVAAHGAHEHDEDDLDEDLADTLADADEYEEADPALDEDFGDDFGEEELDEGDEDQIAARVLEAFINDPILAERSVEIEADDDGDVVLYGAVRTAREVAHAVTIARGVPGVTRVRQRLSVRGRR